MHLENNANRTTLLRIKDVREITGLGVSTIYAKVAQDLFPKPIKLTNTSSAWIASEVEEWVQSRIAESRAA